MYALFLTFTVPKAMTIDSLQPGQALALILSLITQVTEWDSGILTTLPNNRSWRCRIMQVPPTYPSHG